jgi:hypothetical protein
MDYPDKPGNDSVGLKAFQSVHKMVQRKKRATLLARPFSDYP